MTETPADPSTPDRTAVARLLALLPLLVSLPRFQNAFAYDDVFVIERGTFIHDASNAWRVFGSHTMVASSLDAAAGTTAVDTYRPVTLLTFFLDAALSGHAPFAYHLTNLLLHAAATSLVFEVARRLFRERSIGVPALLAAWFAACPALAEAHVFINGRSDPLAAVFFLGAWLSVLHAFASPRRRAPLALASVLGLLALGSKEVVLLALPLLAASPVPTSAPAPTFRVRGLALASLLAPCVIYLGLRTIVLDGMRIGHGGQQSAAALLNAPLLVFDAIGHVLVPFEYHLRSMFEDYARLPGIALPIAWTGAAAGLNLMVRHRHRTRFVFGVALALATLAPVSVISTLTWPGFGRYLYVPAVGILLAAFDLGVVWVDESAARTRWVRWLAVGQVVVASAMLWLATKTYRNDLSLFGDAYRAAPDQAFSVGFYGLSLRTAHRCPEAVPLLALADRRAPFDPRYLQGEGNCAFSLGRLDDARRIAIEGESRFSGLRTEAGFLMLHSRATPTDSRNEHRARMVRCLRLDPQRADCVAGLRMLDATR